MQEFILTIAAHDTSGGAGIEKDLKTFYDLGYNGLSVVTGITAQTFTKVLYQKSASIKDLEMQMKTVFENFAIKVVKIGVVFNKQIMKSIQNFLIKYSLNKIVIDPIISATDSTIFLNKESITYLKDSFLKIALVITPNIPELEIISQSSISDEEDIIEKGSQLSKVYDSFIFIKGGHLKLNNNYVYDFIIYREFVERLKSKRKKINQTHGTGCIISSAIAANLMGDYNVTDSIIKAKEYFDLIIK